MGLRWWRQDGGDGKRAADIKPPRTATKNKDDESLPFALGILYAAIVWTGAVLGSVICYTGWNAQKISVGLLAAFAASAVGALIGFLFGVPKGPSSKDGQQQSGSYYRPNTNLEEVSDWLTKIIVGVGLIQFRQIGIVILGLGQAVGAAVGDIAGMKGSGTVFAVALMSATAAVVFVLAYMWTATTVYEVYSRTYSPRRTTMPLGRRRPPRR